LLPNQSAPYRWFTCQHCGWCCQNQLIRVFSTEIHAITVFLREQPHASLEEHLIGCLAYEGSSYLYGVDFTDRWSLLHNFVEPYEYENYAPGVAVIKTLVVTLLPKSRRCVFYNPILARCFIYPVRPVTCRLFPFTVNETDLTLVSEGEHCPGVNTGAPITFQLYDSLTQQYNKLLQHDTNYFRNFVHQAGYRVRSTPESTDDLPQRKRFIDPFSAPMTPHTRQRLTINHSRV
jgi:Fe-S-cluster containining protein